MINRKIYTPLTAARLKGVAADPTLYNVYLDGLMYLHDALSGLSESHGPSRFEVEALSYGEQRVLRPLSETQPALASTLQANYHIAQGLLEAGTAHAAQETENFLDALMDEYRDLRAASQAVGLL